MAGGVIQGRVLGRSRAGRSRAGWASGRGGPGGAEVLREQGTAQPDFVLGEQRACGASRHGAPLGGSRAEELPEQGSGAYGLCPAFGVPVDEVQALAQNVRVDRLKEPIGIEGIFVDGAYRPGPVLDLVELGDELGARSGDVDQEATGILPWRQGAQLDGETVDQDALQTMHLARGRGLVTWEARGPASSTGAHR